MGSIKPIMSARKPSQLCWVAALALLAGVPTLPKSGACDFTSPFHPSEPTSKEANQLLEQHPTCAALILYSMLATEHPALLIDNLDLGREMADAFSSNELSYDDMIRAFSVIALHLSEHRNEPQLEAVDYWRRACDDMERCLNETATSTSCKNARSAVDNYAF